MLVLLGISILIACGACFGLGWFACDRGHLRDQRDAALLAGRAIQGAQAVAAEEQLQVVKDIAELGKEDNLGLLLREKVK